MDKFKHLVKSKNQAVSVFKKAHTQLNDVLSQIRSHTKVSLNRIAESNKKIEEEEASLRYLRDQAADVTSQMDKISQFIS